jgi:hypothetical protein
MISDSRAAEIAYRYETKFLGHTVSIRVDPSGVHELAIDGPTVGTRPTRTFLRLDQAKMAAHGFAHRALGSTCDCGITPLMWVVVPES